MGGNLCTFRQSSSRKDQYESDDKHFINQGTSIVTTSVMQRAGCCFKIMTKRKQLQLQLESSPVKKLVKMKKVITLEEWLTTSPANVKPDNINSSGELHVFRQSSRKVHPSIGRVNDDEQLHTKQKESLDLVMDDVEASKADVLMTCSSLSRSQSGKSKKKVSFRLPEEADIIVFYSPEEVLVSKKIV
ncbi:hypothetical protein FRX31_013304 [Thalictrum thalictroides]|uniref:Uncharacterized protein n=1 Tax=Thalictrum thalictroides TaxID=46969 RepID=A0A7J6WI64_THATH|nr:hypothetical protein FRX31_013304 [Thalictrum thalictroides]